MGLHFQVHLEPGQGLGHGHIQRLQKVQLDVQVLDVRQ